MADLPALEEIPEELLGGGKSGVVKKNAQWAATFGGSGTNLAQRRRHNADIRSYAEQVQEEQAAAAENDIRTKKTAMDFYFRSKDLENKHRMAEASLAEREQRMRMADELQPLKVEHLRATTKQVGATERRKLVEEKMREEHTAGVNNAVADMMERGVKRQSPEWSAGLARALSDNSHADPATVRLFGSQLFPREDLTEDEMIAKAEALAARFPNASVTVNPRTGASATVRPEKDNSPAERKAIQDRLARVEAQRNKTNLDADQKAYFDEEIRAAKAQLEGMGGQAPAATAAAPAAPQAAFDSPDDFKSAFSSAKSGDVLTYKGKQYRKP